MTVTLDTRNGLLQDLDTGRKKRKNPLCCENNLHSCHQKCKRLPCALILAFKGQFMLEGTSEVSPVKCPLKAGLILKMGWDAVFGNP